jgi:aminoglycoside 3-N-acetyltransferase
MNKLDVINDLKKVGITQGDVILLHSSLVSIGYVDGGADAVIDAFLDIIGPEGTLVAPVFGASLGIITNLVKGRPEAIISNNPKGCVAAIGKDAAFICENHADAETAHGEDTPYLKIANLGGKICLLGVDQDRNTTLHSVEALLRLPYLKSTTAIISTSEGDIEKTYPYYPGPHRDFIQLDHLLREQNKIKIGKVGNSVIRIMKSRDMIDAFVELGTKNPAFCLCDNPNCADCVGQKADIFSSEIGKESFTLGTSGILAGRYVPEMVENMKRAGITHIELDYIEGKPIQKVDKVKLSNAVTELRDNGIEIIALRSSVADLDISGLLERATENKITSVSMPLNGNMKSFIEQASEQDISISFYNTSQGAEAITAELFKLKEFDIKPSFIFNAANFATVGEMPFLGSYKKKLRRFITQLDIEDITFDSTPTTLAKGNAEIKELMSILRCASYNGYFVLGAKNRFTATLEETKSRFTELLKTM